MSELVRFIYDCDEATGMQTAAAQISHSSAPFRIETGRCPAHLRSSRSNQWSREELRRLRELVAAGTPLEIIATTLRRTVSAVRNKAGMHGISLRAQR